LGISRKQRQAVIDGIFERWPRTQKYPTPGGRVGVLYGKPIPAEYINEIGEEKFIAEFNQTLHQMHNDLRQKLKKWAKMAEQAAGQAGLLQKRSQFYCIIAVCFVRWGVYYFKELNCDESTGS